MSSRFSATPDLWLNVPTELRSAAEGDFVPGEQAVAWFEPDLDRQLHFAGSLVVLTDRRIVSIEPAANVSNGGFPQQAGGAVTIESWPIHPGMAVDAKEQGGAACLELLGPDRLLAQWRYSPARTAAAHRFSAKFKAIHEGATTEDEQAESSDGVCSTCGALVAPDQAICAACAAAAVIGRPARSLLRLLRFAKLRAGMALLGFSLALVSTAASLVPPYLTKPILDDVLVPYQNGEDVNFNLVTWYLSGLALASIATWLLTWGRTFVLAWVSERVSADLRTATYSHLQRLSLEFFGGKRTGDLIARVSTDTDRICYFLSVHLLDFASDVLMIAMTAAILLLIDFHLALATLVPLPLITYLVYKVRSRLRGGFQVGSRAWAEMTSVLADTIPGIRVVKAFAQEQREIDRFRRANDRVLHANDRVNRLWAFFGPLVVVLTDAGLLVVWVFGVWRVYNHHITVGVLTAFLAYIARFYMRLDSMSRMVSATQRAAAAAQRVFGILDRAATVPEPVNPVRPGRLRGKIELRDVRFRYGNRAILDGVDLCIEPGEMIGLVGPSGAGKTTLVNLVCRFYDVSEGAVLVDGTDIRSFAIEDYRRHIGLVLQEPFLFYGTIAENIAYGRPNATREEILAAARAARAHDFILRLPDGYDSLVGERGQSLSGGERQRISIARALLIDPRILILDEATSSVDTETEREIQLALDNLIEGRTTIAIAHRLSTLRRANRLVVIERGRITEMGQHEALLAAEGTYARLYHAQSDSAEGKVK